MKNYKLEICIDSVFSAKEAEKAGADRLELCSDLFEGGLTPSYGMIEVVKKSTQLPVNVMIRPRGGDFCYSDDEFTVMKSDLVQAKKMGADGLVFGILTPDGLVDKERCSVLMELAGTTPVTFHRAFDVASLLDESFEDIISLGCTRLLTSGQEASVAAGKETLRYLVEKAKGRIIVLPGAGFTTRNFHHLKDFIGASEYHVTMGRSYDSAMTYRRSDIYMGGALRQAEFSYNVTDSSKITSLFS